MANRDIHGKIEFGTTESDELAGALRVSLGGEAADILRQAAGGPTAVTLTRSASHPTQDEALWLAIRERTDAIGFNCYADFIERVLCEPATTKAANHSGPEDIGAPSVRQRLEELKRRPSIRGTETYEVLKLATHAFLLFEGGLIGGGDVHSDGDNDGNGKRAATADEERASLTAYLEQLGGVGQRNLPYLNRIVRALLPPGLRRQQSSLFGEGILQNRLHCPAMIELLWNFWHDAGGLVQTIDAIAFRFQNRSSGERDPLGHLELDPLRPLNNLLWGFVQDEDKRLSLVRREYEYLHEYGLELSRTASKLEPADTRSQFLGAFHNLLYLAAEFYRQETNTTMIPDTFRLLQSLKQVHLVVSEGAANEFSDLPFTARAEFLIIQWLLSRNELREFLPGRPMTPYREPWMRQVESMKRLQGWDERVSVSDFRDLAAYGERLLLSVRYGNWSEVSDQEQARNWARSWKPDVQCYIHSYQAVTGVDLGAELRDVRAGEERSLQPSLHIRRRQLSQQRRSESPRLGAKIIRNEELSDYALPASRTPAGLLRRWPEPRFEPSTRCPMQNFSESNGSGTQGLFRSSGRSHGAGCRCPSCEPESEQGLEELELVDELSRADPRRRNAVATKPGSRAKSQLKRQPARPAPKAERRRPVLRAHSNLAGGCVCPASGSEFVRWVQSSLNAVRGLRLPVTGVMGPDTRSALRAFQKEGGLPVDGIAGPETQRALESAKGQTPGAEAAPSAEPAEAASGEELETLELLDSEQEQFLSSLLSQASARAQQGLSYVMSRNGGASAPSPSPFPAGGSRVKAVHVNVPFFGYQTNDAAGCFRRCSEMAKAVGVTVGGPDVRIQVAISEDSAGHVTIDPAKAREGIAYIDSELNQGRPVCVGVSYMDASYNVDVITDHFVAVTGRDTDAQGRVYYSFHDPARTHAADGSDQNASNRFYLSPEGGLFRPPSLSGGLGKYTYEVSMVRRNV